MIKKIFSFILVIFILNITFLPAFAGNEHVINTKIVSDLDVNKSKKGQIVQFITTEDCKIAQDIVIPKNTLINGEISSKKTSRFAFRRAKVAIKVKEMVLPNGNRYTVKGHTKRKVYKGSAIGNTAKGIFGTPVALVVGAMGGIVIILEVVTIVGLVLVAPTGVAIGGTMGKLTNGVNCKIEKGRNIPVKINIGKLTNYTQENENLINNNTKSETSVQPQIDNNNVEQVQIQDSANVQNLKPETSQYLPTEN